MLQVPADVQPRRGARAVSSIGLFSMILRKALYYCGCSTSRAYPNLLRLVVSASTTDHTPEQYRRWTTADVALVSAAAQIPSGALDKKIALRLLTSSAKAWIQILNSEVEQT